MLLDFIFQPTIETAEQVPVAHNGGGAHPAPRRTCLLPESTELTDSI